MPASDTWPWRSAPIPDPRRGLVCGAEHSPGIVTCPGAVRWQPHLKKLVLATEPPGP